MQAVVTAAQAVEELSYLEEFGPEAVVRSVKSSLVTISALGAAASANVAGEAVYLENAVSALAVQFRRVGCGLRSKRTCSCAFAWHTWGAVKFLAVIHHHSNAAYALRRAPDQSHRVLCTGEPAAIPVGAITVAQAEAAMSLSLPDGSADFLPAVAASAFSLNGTSPFCAFCSFFVSVLWKCRKC